ncbi:MAG: hypothetical protein LBD12_06205 [Clostridiales Family XIII bacterium]|jgi:hypothetical protein|nr:hypothetical protein [Clostridiales Family XIII bacterium]
MTVSKAISRRFGDEAPLELFASEVIRDIREKFEQRRSQRRGLELQWRLNIEFYNGNQFADINASLGDIETLGVFSEFEERNVFNEIAPIVETALAILSRKRHIMRVTPASSSSEDRTSAKIGNKVVASMRRRLNISDLFQDGNIQAKTTGSAVWKTVWDPNAGRTVAMLVSSLTDEEMQIEGMQPSLEEELLGIPADGAVSRIREGDVSISVHSPFEFYPENVSIPCSKNRRVMHVQVMSPDEVFEKWGVVAKGDDIDVFKVVDTTDRSYGGAVSGRVFGKMFGVEKARNSVRVYEEWELPSRKFPSGRLIICTDEDLLHYGPLPDALGGQGEYALPFDVQQSVRTDGFFGKSVIERLIPIQRAFNSNKNRIADYMNRIGIGVYVCEEGSVPDIDKFISGGIMPGDVIEHMRGTRAPHFLDTPSLPPDIYRETDALLDEMDRLAGISRLAKQSEVSPSISAASAIAGLAEQDDTRIGLEADNAKATYISFTRKALILYHDNVKYPRMVADIGRNDEFEISQFRGSDLTSFDISIEPEPEASDTLAQRRQKIVELLNAGLFADPETGRITNEGRIMIFEMLELGNWDAFIESDNEHQRRAHRENQSMMAGDAATLFEFDDDLIHIGSHNNFRLKSEYEEALKERPELDQLFAAHVEEHILSLEQKQIAQAQPDGLPHTEQPGTQLDPGFGEIQEEI